MSVSPFIPLLMAVLLLASAFFSAAETAFFSLEPIEIQRRTARGQLFADALGWCHEHGRKVLFTVLLSNLAVNTLYFALAAQWAGQGTTSEALLVAVLALLAVIFLAEILPKSLALGQAGALASLCSPVLRLMSKALTPCTVPAIAFLELLSRRLVSTPAVSLSLTQDEVEAIVRRRPESFGLRQRTARVIGEIVTLTEVQVREIMSPYVDLEALPVTLSLGEALSRALRLAKEWMPVEEGQEFLGIVDTKTLIVAPEERSLRELTQTLAAIPETARLHHLLALFRETGADRVLVVDEYGELAGIVGWEDLSEEMLGNLMRSELAGDEAPVKLVRGKGWELSGSLGVSEFEDLFSVDLPVARNRTIGGWIVDQLERLPRGGERIEELGFCFEVLQVERGRVLKVFVSPLSHAAAARMKQGEGPC